MPRSFGPPTSAFDGNGYPDRLGAERIPLAARIIAVSGAYDAMISGRPYRGTVPHEDALAELRRCAGSQFDPRIVKAFAAQFAEGPPVADRLPMHVPETSAGAPLSAAQR